MEKVAYLGQPNCYKLSNGDAELVVTTDVGPRVMRYALTGEENVLGELPDATLATELGEWKPWGGHRLWGAPEAMPRSYAPDNSPVAYELLGEREIRLKQPVETATGLEKELLVRLDEEGSGARVEHRITNRNLWAIEVAPWALTIMRGGGTAIVPQEPYRSHDDYLLPARALVLWHYTDLSDPRWRIGARYIRLKTDETMPEPQKIGVANKQGWAAYHVGHTLFVKRFDYREGAAYPDCGSNNEIYTAGSFIEVESLAPLARLEPGETAEHVERWQLFSGVELSASDEDEASVEAAIGHLTNGKP